MNKKEAIVDTCFFNKLSNDGKNIDGFKKVLNELEYIPVVHPYVFENELSMFGYFDNLVKEGFIRVADYSEFLPDKSDEQLYESYFVDLHDEIRGYYDIAGGKKQIEKLSIPNGQTVFTYRKAGNSLGDVHIILMAFFLKLPIVLSEDGDIDILRSIAKRKISRDTYDLQIFNVMDLIMKIAQSGTTNFTKSEIQKLVLDVRERSQMSSVKKAWNESHE